MVSLNDLMGWEEPVTHAQFLVMGRWLDLEWDKPSRGDHYAMQTAAEVRLCRRAFSGGEGVSLNDLKIEFGSGSILPPGKEGVPANWTDEDEAEYQKQLAMVGQAAAMQAVGGKVEHRRISKTEHEAWMKGESDGQ